MLNLHLFGFALLTFALLALSATSQHRKFITATEDNCDNVVAGVADPNVIPKSAVTLSEGGSNCTKYGDAPATVIDATTSEIDLLYMKELCFGQMIPFTDLNGATRYACFYANPASTNHTPLPLMVWMHPAGSIPPYVFPFTTMDWVRDTQQLNNESPSARGFSYIQPFGRTIVTQYHQTNVNTFVGWDNWYRNMDRTDPKRNVDVDLVDQSIAYAKANVPVDTRRVYMSGWSNGAAFALLYALNTDGIASASVYSAPDAYRDVRDPCAQTPEVKFATPIQDVHNRCDTQGSCTTAKYFFDDLRLRYGHKLHTSLVIIDNRSTDILSRDAKADCDPACQGVCLLLEGYVAHNRYPTQRNTDTIFQFMYDHPLPKSGTWGRL